MSEQKVKILFLASNPDQTQEINLDEEFRSIKNKIRSSDYYRKMDLVSAWAVRPDDLLQELNEHRPVIVHFSGHGSNAGEIILTGDNEESLPIDEPVLKALFFALKDNIRLVVLNTCYSKQQAEAISQVIDCVVSMKTSVPDDVAITFSAAFYYALGSCRSVQAAFVYCYRL